MNVKAKSFYCTVILFAKQNSLYKKVKIKNNMCLIKGNNHDYIFNPQKICDTLKF